MLYTDKTVEKQTVHSDKDIEKDRTGGNANGKL